MRFVAALTLATPACALTAAFGNIAGATLSGEEAAGKCSEHASEAKDIDVTIFGATGFTGTFATEFLASHRQALRWAVSGRSASKLVQLVSSMEKTGVWQNGRRPEIIVADLANASSLAEMTRRSRAVLNYVGPYQDLGAEELVKAAITGCAHYVDVTGEIPWAADMQHRYHAQAEARGVAVVHLAGFEALPGDLLGALAARALAADGKGPPSQVQNTITQLLTSGFTTASLNSGKSIQRHGGAEPYMLMDDDASSLAARAGDKDAGQTPIVMRRTMGHLFPGVPIHVQERIDLSKMNMLDVAQFTTDPRIIFEPPKLGKTPPVWAERKGSFALEATAWRNFDNKRVRFMMTGRNSPSYLGTAKISAELAIGLALDGPGSWTTTAGANAGGGFLTPALALAGGPDALSARLSAIEGGQFIRIWRQDP